MPTESTIELQWETVACEWCGTPHGQLLLEGPDLQFNLPGRFRMVRCLHCGLIRQDPRLTWETLQHYYPNDFCSFVPAIDEDRSWLRRLDKRYGMWKLLRAIERFQRGGRLLDIGCGTGNFLAEAQRTGRWTVMGIEPSHQAAAYARRIIAASVWEGRFSEVAADLPVASFDVITLWNVLEHLPEPIADLRRVHRLLQDGGWMILTIPNMESLAARVFGPYWLGWELPRHLYLFPRKTLDSVLKAVGFQVVGWQCLMGSYATLGYSLEFWTRAWAHRYPRLVTLLLSAYRNPITRALLLLPLWVLDRLKLTTVITVFARKTASENVG